MGLLYLFTIITTTAIEFHSVAVVLTLVQKKQIRKNLHKRNNTKTVQTIQNTLNIFVNVEGK
jgi:hypothetical protein